MRSFGPRFSLACWLMSMSSHQKGRSWYAPWLPLATSGSTRSTERTTAVQLSQQWHNGDSISVHPYNNMFTHRNGKLRDSTRWSRKSNQPGPVRSKIKESNIQYCTYIQDTSQSSESVLPRWPRVPRMPHTCTDGTTSEEGRCCCYSASYCMLRRIAFFGSPSQSLCYRYFDPQYFFTVTLSFHS